MEKKRRLSKERKEDRGSVPATTEPAASPPRPPVREAAAKGPLEDVLGNFSDQTGSFFG